MKSINNVEKRIMFEFKYNFYDVMIEVVVMLGILDGLFVLVKFVVGEIKVIVVIEI